MKKKLLFALAGLLAGAIILGGCSNASGGAGENEPSENESDGLPIANYVSVEEAEKIIKKASKNETIDLYVMVENEREIHALSEMGYLSDYMKNAKCKINLYIKGPKGVESFRLKTGITSLISVHLGDNFTSLLRHSDEEGCLENCANLKNVFLPNSITEIDNRSFKGCTALEKINLPKNLKIISERCFENCTSLKEIELPKNLETIGSFAFKNSGASSMKDILIPASVKEININAFTNCNANNVIPENKEIYWEPVNPTSNPYIGHPRKVENFKVLPIDKFTINDKERIYNYEERDSIWQPYTLPKTIKEIESEGYIYIEQFEQNIKDDKYNIAGEHDIKLFIRGDEENISSGGDYRINKALIELANKNIGKDVKINLDIGCYNNFQNIGYFKSNVLKSIKFSIDPSFKEMDLSSLFLSGKKLNKIEIPSKTSKINIYSMEGNITDIAFSDMKSTWDVFSEKGDTCIGEFKPTDNSNSNCVIIKQFGQKIELGYYLKKLM